MTQAWQYADDEQLPDEQAVDDGQLEDDDVPPDEGEESDMAPEGHDDWMKQFQYATRNDPTLYGVCKRYSDDMAREAGGTDPNADEQVEDDPGEDDPGYEEQGYEEQGDEQGYEQDDEQDDEQDENRPTPQELAALLADGAHEMPEPQGDQHMAGGGSYLPGQMVPGQHMAGGPPQQAQYGGSFVGKAGKAGIGGVAGGLLGAGIGAFTGDPLKGAAIGAGAGALGGATLMQNNEVPVAYQAALRTLESRMARTERNLQSKDREIANLKGVNARKDSELIVYQLQLEGVAAIADPRDAERLTQHLASLPHRDRALKVQEIRSCWERDASLAYAAHGAPTGDFLPLTGQRVEAQQAYGFGEQELEKALAYMRSTHKPWNECMTYAMNGHAVVTG